MLGAVGSLTPQRLGQRLEGVQLAGVVADHHAARGARLARVAVACGDLAHGDLEVRALRCLQQEVAVPVGHGVGRGRSRRGEDQGGEEDDRSESHARALPGSPG